MYLSIDVGGTKTALALFSDLVNPKIVNQNRFTNLNNFEKDYEELVKRMSLLIQGNEITSIGIGLPAILNEEKSAIKVSGNLSSWQGKNLKSMLQKNFNVPVYLDQDSSNAALGEYTYANHGNKDFIFLIWGTGVGGTKVFKKDSEVRVDPFEAGYQIISKENDFEYLEFNIGGRGIENRFQKKAESLTDDEWNLVINDLATGIYNMQVLCGYKTFIIGGGIALKQQERLSKVREILKERLEILDFEPAEIILSKLGEDAGLFGALALQDVAK